MSTILDLSRSKDCADPRDKLYGLLGLTAPLFNTSIKADYSLPVEQVYNDAFIAHTGVTQRLELLKHCILAKRSTGGPSWVPDWSKADFAAPILSEQFSGAFRVCTFKYISPNVLEVVGIRCTTVQTVSVAASTEMDKVLLIIHYLSVSEFVYLLREIESLDVDSDKDPIYLDREIANTIQKTRGRVFFITEGGQIGTARRGIQLGEIDGSLTLWLRQINLYRRRSGVHFPWLLPPMILRPVDFEKFQVVGEAYIHGLEDAVGVLGPLPAQWKVIISGDTLGQPLHRYLNLSKYEQTAEDPRLNVLSPEWERLPYEKSLDDPALFEILKNSITGETINSGP